MHRNHETSSVAPAAPLRVLRVNASARGTDSVTHALGDALIARLRELHRDTTVVTRDVSQGLEFVDQAWVGANYTGEAQRSSDQQARLALSDTLVEEVRAAQVLVIAVPVYNFGIPASLKAWIDLVARVQRTFRYTENGPVGLLGGRKAYLVYASGGVAVGSEMDFASSYMRHVLGFLGITDVDVIAADRVALDSTGAWQRARARIAELEPRREAAA